MTVEELKESTIANIKMRWEQIQDSSLFQQLKDRYENLSPQMQKVAMASTALILALILLSFPYGYYEKSQNHVADFETKRGLLENLMTVLREKQEAPQIPAAPDMGTLESMVNSALQAAQLIPEQIKGTQVLTESGSLVPAQFSQGVLQVNLVKLTTRQIVDIGYQLQSLNPSVKLKDLALNANKEDSRYFDAVFHLLVLAVPQDLLDTPEETEPPPSPNKKGRGK